MGNVIGEPRTVAAGRGVGWWADGWRIFTSGLWTWIGMAVIYVLVSLLIALVPYVGSLGQSLLTPVFVGGVMLGCLALDRDAPLRVAHLFEGFQGAHFVPLLIIGVVNIAITFGIVVIAAGSVFGGMHLSELARMGTVGDPMAHMERTMGAIGPGGAFAGLLGLVILTLMAMLNWFAPALVVLRGASALDAMKASFIACWRNLMPFLLYGLVALAIGVAAMAAMGAIALMMGVGALASASGNGAGWIGAIVGFAVLFVGLMLALALVVGPVAIGSIYAGYKDVFADDEAAVPNPAHR
jgi:hypothetical protein